MTIITVVPVPKPPLVGMRVLDNTKEDNAKINGTSLIGYIKTTYAELRKVLGEPRVGCDKTTSEWAVQLSEHIVATIYDWKTDSTPMGMYDWHVGGRSGKALEMLEAALRTNGADIKEIRHAL